MTFRVLLAVIALVGMGGSGSAQDDSLQDIPETEWRDMALGRTLTYMVGDAPFAIERYSRTGDQVELQFANGECFTGTWTHTENLYCFDWGYDRPHCFRHVRAGDRILIINVVDGEESGDIQEMTQVSDAPLACGQNMS